MSTASDHIQPGKSQWIGKPVRRLEDQHLMTGRGKFTDDVSLPNQSYAAFARSPHAHARIVRIDTAEARKAPGVIAVITGADLIADGVGQMPFSGMHKRPDGSPITAPPRYPLTADAARYVGHPFAMIVAETRNQAKDAAELVEVEWEELPAVADAVSSARADAPQLWPPAFTPEYGNLAAYYHRGDKAAADAAFAAAHKVVSIRIVNNRIVSNPIEPKGAAAQYDAGSGTLTLWCPTQNTHVMRQQVAEAILKMPVDKLRVITGDLGGGFGTRVWPYPEYASVAYAARKLGRPVKWLADRSETFLSDNHGRDHVSEAALALDREHRFTALRIRTYANIGGVISNFGAAVPAMSGARTPTGVYRIPVLDQEVRMMFTSTTPVDAYRGAGRPEAGYLMERLASRAAIELGVDPVDLRRKNFVRPQDMPYTNAAGYTYDCGNFEGVLDKALAAADWNGFPARKADAKRRGRLAGRGVACYVEVTGSANLTEAVDVTVTGDGRVIVVSGTQSMGTSLWTAYAQIVAERLGVAPETVTVIQGDTAVVKTGGGSGGSRSAAGRRQRRARRSERDGRGGTQARGRRARGGRGRHRVPRRALRDRRHRPRHRPLRARGEAAGSEARRVGLTDGEGSDLAERLPDRGGGDRAGDGHRESRAPRRGRRHRARDEPADRARPDRGRDRAGHRAGARRADGLRRGRPAADRLVHGLRDAARRRRAELSSAASTSRPRRRSTCSVQKAQASRARTARYRRWSTQ